MNKLVESRNPSNEREGKWNFWVDGDEVILSNGSVSIRKIGEVLSNLFRWGENKEKPK